MEFLDFKMKIKRDRFPIISMQFKNMQIWRNDKESYLINIINIKLMVLKFNKRKSKVILRNDDEIFPNLHRLYMYIYITIFGW